MIRICKKELLLFLKDPKALLMSILLPIALITLFAMAFGELGGSKDGADPIELPVADLDQSPQSKEVLAQLDSSRSLFIEQMDLETAKEAVKKGKYTGVLVIHPGFGDSIKNGGSLPLELQYDAAREIETGILQSVLIGNLMETAGNTATQNKIGRFIRGQFGSVLDSASLANLITEVEKGIGGGSGDFRIEARAIVGPSPKNSPGLVQAVAGTAVMMLLFSVSALGASLLEEKERGTLKKLLFSPIRPEEILLGKMLAGLSIAFAQLLIMFLFAGIVLGLNIMINVPALLFLIIATAFVCTAFGVFLASISKTRAQVQSLSTIVILVMSAIGGSMIPLFVMPAFMRTLAVGSVNYWSIQGFYDIFWRELPLLEILPRIGVLLGIGLVLTLISLRLFRKTVQNLT